MIFEKKSLFLIQPKNSLFDYVFSSSMRFHFYSLTNKHCPVKSRGLLYEACSFVDSLDCEPRINM